MDPGAYLVSVIMTVYNGERFLGEAIQSALDQTYEPKEILLIDDGSVDQSAVIARSFKSIRYIRQAHQGVAAARNNGLDIAQGGLISFLDADDIWNKHKITKQVDYLQKNRQLNAVICRFCNFFEPGVRLPEWIDPEIYIDEKTGMMPSLCTILIRREAFDRVGLFDPGLETGSDLDWFARAKDEGISLEILPELLVSRRLHDQNLSYQAHHDRSQLLKIFKASLDRKRQGDKSS